MPTITHRPIDQLTDDWEAQRRAPASREALAALAAAEPEIAAVPADDLGDLVSWLRPDARPRTATAGDRDSAASVLRAMLRSQGVHPLVPRAILQAIVPGLVTIARRLAWGAGGDWDDGGAFFVDTITAAWEVIVDWSGQDRQYAVLDLLSAVRCRLRRQLLAHRSRVEHQAILEVGDLGEGNDDGGPPTAGATALDELAQAIDDITGSGIEVTDAAVLYAHRVLGYTLTELSTMTGTSRRLLGVRRDRAAAALLA